jgi:hypothetical protein
MKKIQVITRPDSEKCITLKTWLGKNKVKYTEWSIDDSDIKRKLLDDDKYTAKYCDLEGCMSKLPMIRLDDTGEYIIDGLFSSDKLQVDAVKKIIGMK